MKIYRRPQMSEMVLAINYEFLGLSDTHTESADPNYSILAPDRSEYYEEDAAEDAEIIQILIDHEEGRDKLW